MNRILSPVVMCAICVATLSGVAAAFPIAPPGTECLKVIVNQNGPVIATYQGNSATYSDDLYLMLDASGNPGDDGILANDLFVFNNHSTPVGTQKNLGTFPAGTELEFRLHVNNTGYDFVTGPGTRNIDGKCHARVQDSWQPNTTLVSFEDLLNTPEGANGFNDLSFSFTNTTNNEPPVPQGFPGNGIMDVCNVQGRSFELASGFTSPEAGQITTTVVTTDIPPSRYTLANTPGNPSQQTLDFTPIQADLGHTYTATYTATDNGVPPMSTTVVVHFVVSLANCPTPVQRSTWGALKTHYR